MTDPTAPAALPGWVPNLTGVSLTELGGMSEEELAAATAALLALVQRPLATIAGSSGS